MICKCGKPIIGKYAVIKDTNSPQTETVCTSCLIERHLLQNFKGRNLDVYQKQEAIFEQIGYGIVNVSYKLHSKRITELEVYGEESRYYNQRKLEGARRIDKKD